MHAVSLWLVLWTCSICISDHHLSRCPTECHLVHSTAPWQCIVSLRFMTGESGQRLDPVRMVPFGPPIKDPKEVEERLRRAQRAVLNPTVDSQRFLERNQPIIENALNFSTNCVSLEIRGPEVTDLSFCDLPGKSVVGDTCSILLMQVLRLDRQCFRQRTGRGCRRG
jgi:hypothetical protein